MFYVVGSDRIKEMLRQNGIDITHDPAEARVVVAAASGLPQDGDALAVLPASVAEGVLVVDAPLTYAVVQKFARRNFAACPMSALLWTAWKLAEKYGVSRQQAAAGKTARVQAQTQAQPFTQALQAPQPDVQFDAWKNPQASVSMGTSREVPPARPLDPLTKLAREVEQNFAQAGPEIGPSPASAAPARSRHAALMDRLNAEQAPPAVRGWRAERLVDAHLNPECAVYASFSTRGGVGKTTLASNLGACLASSGERAVVVDFDPSGNLAEVLGMEKKAAGSPNVSNWRSFGKEFTQRLARHSSGFYLMSRGSEPVGEPDELLAALSYAYRYVIVDFGNNPFADYVQRALDSATLVFLVTVPEQGYMETLVSQFLEQKKEWVESGKARLVINRVTPASFYRPEQVARMGGFKTWTEIPEDPNALTAARKAGKVVVQLKKSDAAKSLLQLGSEIMGRPAAEASFESGFLGRLFKKN